MAGGQTILSSPKYSFVQLTDVSNFTCAPEVKLCLPLSRMFDVQFQMYVDQWGSIPDGGAVRTIYAVPQLLDTCVTGELPDVGSIFQAIPANIYSIGDGVHPPFAVINFGGGSYNFSHWNSANEGAEINIGSCFRLMLIEEWLDESGNLIQRTGIGCTNCFIRTAEDFCFMSVLKYQCNENSFGFKYTPDSAFMNSIQLPFYLKNPQLIQQQQSYQLADGSYRKLTEQIDEDWELETDWLPYHWHKCLKVALGHDTVSIANNYHDELDPVNGNSFFIQLENYLITWNPSINYPNAKATTKLRNALPSMLMNTF